MTEETKAKSGYTVSIELFIPASVNDPKSMMAASRQLLDLEFRDYADRSMQDDGYEYTGDEIRPVSFSFKHVNKRKA